MLAVVFNLLFSSLNTCYYSVGESKSKFSNWDNLTKAHVLIPLLCEREFARVKVILNLGIRQKSLM